MRRRTAALLPRFLLGAALGLAFASAAAALDASELPAAIESAKTPADHEAIAAYYEAEAKAARAEAERHRAMGQAYGKRPTSTGSRGTRSPLSRTMPAHCEKLVASYTAAAEEYEALAAAHREAASGGD